MPRAERLFGIVIVLVMLAAAVVAVAVLGGAEDPDAGSGGRSGAPSDRDPDGAPPSFTETGTVVRVVDGDTIVVETETGRVRVRYVGVDAPELATPEAGGRAECGGDEARAANEALVAGRRVSLERDASDTDRFDRLLRHVWLVDGGIRLVAEELVSDGAIEVRSYPPDTRRDGQLDAAERLARSAGLGIWGAC